MSLSTQTFTTQYVTETTTTAVIVSPTLISSDVTITVTSHLASTVTATLGQTVTIHSPAPAAPLSSSTVTEVLTLSSPSSLLAPATIIDTTAKYTPSPITIAGTVTLTVTNLDIYLQNTAGSIYSTWAIPFTPAHPFDPASSQNPGLVYVVNPSNDDGDWDSWNTGERAGLIVGVILAACLLFAVIWYYCRQSWTTGNWWFAQGWPQNQVQPPVVGVPGSHIVQATHINGPLVPYAYQPGPVYGIRGGAGKQKNGRLVSGRNWFRAERRVPVDREQEEEVHDGHARDDDHTGTSGEK